MITVNCLSHWFGDKQVLDNLSLTVRDGEILGLIGVNGAGKSTFLRLISGVMTPTEGDVWYDGLPISKGETRKNMFFLPDDPFYEVGMNCRDLFNLYQTFYPGIQRDVFDDLIGFAGLPSRKPLSSFSKGMRRQAFSAIAFAIARFSAPSSIFKSPTIPMNCAFSGSSSTIAARFFSAARLISASRFR